MQGELNLMKMASPTFFHGPKPTFNLISALMMGQHLPPRLPQRHRTNCLAHSCSPTPHCCLPLSYLPPKAPASFYLLVGTTLTRWPNGLIWYKAASYIPIRDLLLCYLLLPIAPALGGLECHHWGIRNVFSFMAGVSTGERVLV